MVGARLLGLDFPGIYFLAGNDDFLSASNRNGWT